MKRKGVYKGGIGIGYALGRRECRLTLRKSECTRGMSRVCW
jgi:hypothetical protein